MKNEIVVSSNLMESEMNKTFCSKSVTSQDDRIDLFNALETCDVLINDIVGQEIVIKDVYCKEYTKVDDETGEAITKYRTIIFDMDGKTYATGSYGLFNSLRQIFAIIGMPTYQDGLKVKVVKKATKNGKQSLSLTLVK